MWFSHQLEFLHDFKLTGYFHHDSSHTYTEMSYILS